MKNILQASGHHVITHEISIHLQVVWLSGNVLASINVVALRRDWLVLGWVTIRRYLTKLLCLAIPLRVGTMSTGDDLGHC